MAIDPEVLKRVNDANPFGNVGKQITEEERHELKVKIARLRAENVTYLDIATELKINYGAIWEWRNQDKEFDNLINMAERHLTNLLEKAALDRAIYGTKKIVVANGRVVADMNDASKPLIINEFDNRLTEFMLKGRMRETYGDRVTTDANVNLRSDSAVADLQARLTTMAEAERAEDPGISPGHQSPT